jgi:hypothetical protein
MGQKNFLFRSLFSFSQESGKGNFLASFLYGGRIGTKNRGRPLSLPLSSLSSPYPLSLSLSLSLSLMAPGRRRRRFGTQKFWLLFYIKNVLYSEN